MRLQGRQDLVSPIDQRFSIEFPSGGDLFENGGKPGAAEFVFRGKVGGTDHRFQVGREPNIHRPAPASRGGLDEGHVDTVHIGAFLAVDLHADKLLIHDRGDLLVLE